jgi:hypothetical protein
MIRTHWATSKLRDVKEEVERCQNSVPDNKSEKERTASLIPSQATLSVIPPE